MTPTPNLQFVRANVWAWLNEELSASDAARFDEILVSDEDAAEFAARIHAVVSSGRAVTEETITLDFDADKLFATIERRLDEASGVEQTSPLATSGADEHNELSDSYEPGEGGVRSSTSRWAYLSGVLAAALVLLGAAIWFNTTNRPDVDDEPSNNVEFAAGAPPPSQTNLSVEQAPASAPVIHSVVELAPGVRMAARGGVIARAEGPDRIVVERGDVVFEFIPDRIDDGLMIVTPDRVVEVVGTIVALSVVDGHTRVDVVYGEVRVTDPAGVTTSLRTGEQLDSDGTVIRADVGTQLQTQWEAEPFVVETHVAELAEAHRSFEAITTPAQHEASTPLVAVGTDTPLTVQPRTRSAQEVGIGREPGVLAPSVGVQEFETQTTDAAENTRIDNLLQQGRAALRRRDHREAAQLLERALREESIRPDDEIAVRLDLSRLYLGDLSNEAAASTHMQQLLIRFADDPATERVRSVFCAIGSNELDDLCQVGR